MHTRWPFFTAGCLSILATATTPISAYTGLPLLLIARFIQVLSLSCQHTIILGSRLCSWLCNNWNDVCSVDSTEANRLFHCYFDIIFVGSRLGDQSFDGSGKCEGNSQLIKLALRFRSRLEVIILSSCRIWGCFILFMGSSLQRWPTTA